MIITRTSSCRFNRQVEHSVLQNQNVQYAEAKGSQDQDDIELDDYTVLVYTKVVKKYATTFLS